MVIADYPQNFVCMEEVLLSAIKRTWH